MIKFDYVDDGVVIVGLRFTKWTIDIVLFKWVLSIGKAQRDGNYLGSYEV